MLTKLLNNGKNGQNGILNTDLIKSKVMKMLLKLEIICKNTLINIFKIKKKL